jgi:hypothetical protein
LRTVQKQIKFKTDELSDLKVNLADKKTKTEAEKERLKLLQDNLEDQKKIVEYNKQEKAKVLTQTKNTEAVYKTLLQQKEAQKAAFEKELFDYESQLKIFIDPTSLPNSRAGVISWPLDKVIITQRFGKTSRQNVSMCQVLTTESTLVRPSVLRSKVCLREWWWGPETLIS